MNIDLKNAKIAVNKLNNRKYIVIEEKSDRVVCFGEVVRVQKRPSSGKFVITHESKDKTFLKKFVDVIETEVDFNMLEEMYNQH